ncbi:hypothetical protein HYX08_03860, partial [Candidatus Woesearchaeota archaeon]|nr:hypothetical protein [Candidatus Woesearchaeota archaeon]
MQAKKIDSKIIETQKNQRFFVPQNSERIFREIELDLLSALFRYAIPFFSGKIDSRPGQEPKPGNLENLVNQRPKISVKDFKELESLILKNLSKNATAGKKVAINSRDIFYSINLRRRKKDENTGKYSVSINYEENSRHEKQSVKIKKDGKEIYSAESNSKKELKDRVAPYGISISYEDRYGEERLSITYRQQLKNYLKKHIEDKEDMTNRVPLKWLNILPESMMGGVLGFTYLGENFMGRRADLTGKTARMVDIHESIHTPDE